VAFLLRTGRLPRSSALVQRVTTGNRTNLGSIRRVQHAHRECSVNEILSVAESWGRAEYHPKGDILNRVPSVLAARTWSKSGVFV